MTTRSKLLAVRLPIELVESLDQIAAVNRRNRTQQVQLYIEDGVSRESKKRPTKKAG